MSFRGFVCALLCSTIGLIVAVMLIAFVTVRVVSNSSSSTVERPHHRPSWGDPNDWTDWQLDLEQMHNGPKILGAEEPVRRSQDEFSWFTDFYPGVPLKVVSAALEQSHWPNDVMLESLSRENVQPVPHSSPTSQMFFGRLHWRDEDGKVYHFNMFLEIDGLIDAHREITFGELLCMAEAEQGNSLTLETCRVRTPYLCLFDTSGPEGLCGDEACEHALLNY